MSRWPAPCATAVSSRRSRRAGALQGRARCALRSSPLGNALDSRVTQPPPAAYPRHEQTNPPHRSTPRPRARARRDATLPGSASSAAAEAGGITVQGTASVTSVPDRAELSFGVESQGQTAKAALAANAAEMRRVIAALKAAGATRREDTVRLALAALQREVRGAGLRRHELRLGDDQGARQGGRRDRRRRRRGCEPGLRAVALERRPGRALPPGAEGGGRERPRERAGDRRPRRTSRSAA